MNSRKMERAAAENSGRTVPVRDLLPRRPAVRRLVVQGWPELGDLGDTVEMAPGTDGAEGVDAVLWKSPAALVDNETVSRARDFLADGGRLVLALAEAVEKPAERAVIRALSENGFVVVREQAAASVEGVSGPVFVARRDPFRMRSFAGGDLEAIGALFTRSFHVQRQPEHWLWKYHQSPWGNRLISLAFDAKDELACHYAGYPMPMWRRGREILALQMGDTMTDPRYRNVGRGTTTLLARTVRHFFSIHRGQKLGFYYGFNTGPIQRFCLWFIGGSRAEPVAYRSRNLAPELAFKNRGDYRIERIIDLGRGIGPAFDRLFQRVAPSYGFLVRRDAAYVDWRYLRCPDPGYVLLAAWHFGDLVGWSVFRRHEDSLVWGDALFLPRHARAAEAILGVASQDASANGAARIDGWFPDRPTFWDAELERLDFEILPEPQELGMVFLPDTIQPPLEELYYTKGDGDLF